MKLYELVKVSYLKNSFNKLVKDCEIEVNYKGFHYDFKASEFEEHKGYEIIKDSEVILVCGGFDHSLVIYTK